MRVCENDVRKPLPERYKKWSDKKVRRVLKRHETMTKIKHRFFPTEDRLKNIGCKVNL